MNRDPSSQLTLADLAVARSGDKGSTANIALIARSPEAWEILRTQVTAKRVEEYLCHLGVGQVVRYEVASLQGLNFVCPGILAGGGSRSLRTDAQGKTLGQLLLQMKLGSSESKGIHDEQGI